MGCSSSTVASGVEVAGRDDVVRDCSRSSVSSFHSKYSMGEKLGDGGFASVHRSHSKDLGTITAVKALDISGGSAKQRAVLLGRAEDEVAVWRRIGEHDHIVQFIEAFQDDGVYRMVMEKCDTSLLERLDQVRCFGAAGIARIFCEMLSGVRHMHSLDVLHRDLKPANLLFGGACGKTVKICDFGLATVVPKAGMVLRAKGSPSYMSPEVVTETCITTKADVWSLGVTAFVMIYGKLPYVSQTGDNRHAISSGKPAPCYEVASGVEPKLAPPDSQEFVMRLVDRDPSKRCTADQALHHDFVRRKACENEHEYDDAMGEESTATPKWSEGEFLEDSVNTV